MASINYKDECMAEIYRGERMREAEIARMIGQTGDQKSSRSDRINAILSWVGKRLVLLGNRLQQRQIFQNMPRPLMRE